MTPPACRSCGAPLEVTVVDLGLQPLSNAYLAPGSEDHEQVYPLHARFCERCFLVQVDDVVPPEEIFSDYAYFSSFSDSWLDHARAFTQDAVERFAIDRDSFVVEVASNDGYLLRNFVERGIPVLGVEPAANVAAVAEEGGVPTRVAFFGEDTARAVVAERGRADLVVANNVFAHVPDLNDFIAGFRALVADEGVISIEVPHLLRLVEGGEFDTIYHEHYSYYSLLAASAALGRHGLRVFDVEELPTHGGSLRILATPDAAPRPTSPRVAVLIDSERAAALDRPAGFSDLARRAAACRDELCAYLESARAEGLTVVAYGAAAKGNTLLNFVGATTELVAFVADRSPHKQGRLLPGSHIPVVDPAEIDAQRPDIVLILPWNLADELREQLAPVRSWGGRLVVGVPHVRELT
ncbi:MAG: putative methyltransferase [Acidimicrobiales bacterium]|nr:putative methyltransferase [Acidimicrobiales bacterium]